MTPEQAVIYRLSGDYNPLHIDPSIGQRAGFGGTILNGLGTYGFAARAIVKMVGGGDPKSLKAIAGRFTSPVRPGGMSGFSGFVGSPLMILSADALEISMWEMGPGPNGSVEVSFVCKDLTSGKVAITNGVAYVKAGASSRL